MQIGRLTPNFFLTGKSLSDDQSLPRHIQLCTQSEPGTLERDVKEVKAKETVSTTKLNSGELSVKYVCERVCFL